MNFSNAFFNSESKPLISSCKAADQMIKSYRPTIHFVAAKLNHSCRPNVGYDFSQNNQRMFTTRDVKQGTELFDCYSDVVYHEPAWVRQLFLTEKYNFDCRCDACASTAVEQEESDGRRMQMKEIAKTLSKRIGATFLYDEHFSLEVKRITGECDESDPYGGWDGTYMRHSNSKSLKPTSDDLMNLLEYIQLLRREGIDHDIVECVELAYDLSVFLDDRDALQQHQLGQSILKLYEVSKGVKHKRTRQFRKKLEKYNKIIS